MRTVTILLFCAIAAAQSAAPNKPSFADLRLGMAEAAVLSQMAACCVVIETISGHPDDGIAVWSKDNQELGLVSFDNQAVSWISKAPQDVSGLKGNQLVPLLISKLTTHCPKRSPNINNGLAWISGSTMTTPPTVTGGTITLNCGTPGANNDTLHGKYYQLRISIAPVSGPSIQESWSSFASAF